MLGLIFPSRNLSKSNDLCHSVRYVIYLKARCDNYIGSESRMSRRLEVCLKCVSRILLKIERSLSLDDVVISRRTIHCQLVVRRISSSFLSFSLWCAVV